METISNKDSINNNTIYSDIRRYWEELKEKRHDMILIRLNSYYYLFNEDAIAAAKTLNLHLDYLPHFKDVCSFPSMALYVYLPRLIRGGNRIAICDWK